MIEIVQQDPTGILMEKHLDLDKTNEALRGGRERAAPLLARAVLCGIFPLISNSYFRYFQLRQSPDTLVHIFIDEIPFSSFLDANGARWDNILYFSQIS